MKNQFTIITFLIFSVVLLHSCGTTKEAIIDLKSECKLEDSTIYESVILPDGSDTVVFKLQYTFYSNTEKAYQDSVNEIIREFLLMSTQFEIPDTISKEPISHSLFTNQLKEFKKSATESFSENEYPMLWDYDCTMELDQQYKLYDQLSFYIYTYTGGAHGNSYTEYNLISKETGKMLSLEEVVSDVPMFTKIAEKYFREERELSETADLNEAGFWFDANTFTCNNNFYLSDDYLVFYYNPYEIAPYVYGPTEFEIPISEVKNILKIDFSKM